MQEGLWALAEQLMGDLPLGRVTRQNNAFKACGCDVFGPYEIIKGRKTRANPGGDKRWIVMYTSMPVRGIHMEVIENMEADSFISSLSRLESNRGVVEDMYSDCGTNFVGAEREMRESLDKLKEDLDVQEALRVKGINWHFNPPTAHHMGGSWERMIRTARKVLHNMLKGTRLHEEKLRTVICEVTMIINSRPLTHCSTDFNDLRALTPNDLMLISYPEFSKGEFTEADALRKRWKHAMYMAQIFWDRWTAEYLPTLSMRTKWVKERRNVRVGELCLMQDEQLHRGSWPMCRITQVFPGDDGKVRKVEVKTQHNTYIRPVHGLVLLECDQ